MKSIPALVAYGGNAHNAYGEQGSKSKGAVVTLFVMASNRHDA
jgi:hypothetical protein